MKTTRTRPTPASPDRSREAEAVEQQWLRTFSTAVVDGLRTTTSYHPRQRVGTALRVMLTVVEAFLVGQTLWFTSLRAIFIRRFGFIRPCPSQKRFKQASAGACFRAALEHLVASMADAAGRELGGPLARFTDVRLYVGERSSPWHASRRRHARSGESPSNSGR